MEARASAKVSIAADERGKTQVRVSALARHAGDDHNNPRRHAAVGDGRMAVSHSGLVRLAWPRQRRSRSQGLESTCSPSRHPRSSLTPRRGAPWCTNRGDHGSRKSRSAGSRYGTPILRCRWIRIALWKGESTPLHLRALGLQGITRPMFLVLVNRTTPVISITRGEYQCWVIPSERRDSHGRGGLREGGAGHPAGAVLYRRHSDVVLDWSSARTVVGSFLPWHRLRVPGVSSPQVLSDSQGAQHRNKATKGKAAAPGDRVRLLDEDKERSE